MLDSFNHVFFLEGGSTATGSPRLPFVRHKNYYLFVNDNSIPTDQAIQSMLSSSFTTPAATPADSVPGAADAEPTNEGDDEVFQHFHLDRFCLPFVCIVCCSATENMFSIRFHDYKHTVETFYETHPEFKKEALKAKYAAHFDLEEEVPRAHLRFGHAESILPLYYLFVGVWGKCER